jgi:hypothetical protein
MRALFPIKKGKPKLTKRQILMIPSTGWWKTQQTITEMWAFGDFLPRFLFHLFVVKQPFCVESSPPQACISDFFLTIFTIMVLICWATGKRHLIWYSKSEQTTKSWYQFPDLGTKMTTSLSGCRSFVKLG